jgi:hypothetical protein
MALTAEQQAEIQLEIDKQVFRLNAKRPTGLPRRAHEVTIEQRRKAKAVRLAKETLLENDRNKPTGERGITASDITAFCRHAY